MRRYRGWRDWTYAVLRWSNDLRAIRRGQVRKRLARRALGKLSGRGIGRITR